MYMYIRTHTSIVVTAHVAVLHWHSRPVHVIRRIAPGTALLHTLTAHFYCTHSCNTPTQPAGAYHQTCVCAWYLLTLHTHARTYARTHAHTHTHTDGSAGESGKVSEGDVILAVDGMSVEGVPLQTVIQLITGVPVICFFFFFS